MRSYAHVLAVVNFNASLTAQLWCSWNKQSIACIGSIHFKSGQLQLVYLFVYLYRINKNNLR